MMLLDQIYCWQGHENGFGNWESKCRLRIFKPHPEVTIVIASDLGYDSGTSITNCAAQVASLVVAEFDINPTTLIWIEHLPYSEVEFSRVEFDWLGTFASSPRWSYLALEQVDLLVGQALRESK